MISAVQLGELQRFNARAVADIPRELRQLRASLSGRSPEVQRDALLQLAPAIADRHGQIIATGSAEWYEQVRYSQVGGTFNARLGEMPNQEKIHQNVRYAAGALFLQHRVNPYEALIGSLTRHVMDVSRATIKLNADRDTRNAGWQRIAMPDGCDFCVMLSQRGGVYKKSTADFASHDSCRCRCSPSWDRDAPEVDVRAYEASDRMESVRWRASDPNASPADRAKAQRVLDDHRRRTREWIDAYRWQLDDFRSTMSDMLS